MKTVHNKMFTEDFAAEEARIALEVYRAQKPDFGIIDYSGMESTLDKMARFHGQSLGTSTKPNISYLGSFGQELMINPVTIVFNSATKELHVLDDKKSIHVFTVDGNHLRSVALEGVGASWFDMDTEGNYWVCDYTGERIVRVSKKGALSRSISAARSSEDKYSRPFRLCCFDDAVYFLASHHKANRVRVSSFNSSEMHPTVEEQVLPFAGNAVSMCSNSDRMLVTARTPNCIFNVDHTHGALGFKPFMGLHKKPIYITDWRGGALVDMQKSLLGVTGDGLILFDIQYTDFLPQRPLVRDLAVLQGESHDTLLIPDNTHQCIHRVAIQLPEGPND